MINLCIIEVKGKRYYRISDLLPDIVTAVASITMNAGPIFLISVLNTE